MHEVHINQIKEHMPVIGADGRQIGMVDHVVGEEIKLAKHDQSDQRHHWIPLNWVTNVDNGQVRISQTSDQAMRQWLTSPRGGGIGAPM